MKRLPFAPLLASLAILSAPVAAAPPLEPTNLEWVRLIPQGPRPPARELACLISVGDPPQVHLLGGQIYLDGDDPYETITHDYRDHWVWNGRRWRQLESEPLPPPCSANDAVYDEARERLVVFTNNDDSKRAEHWEWHPDEGWSQLPLPTALQARRSQHVLTYDAPNERILLVAGIGDFEDVIAARHACDPDFDLEAAHPWNMLNYCWNDVWEFADGQWQPLTSICDETSPFCMGILNGRVDSESGRLHVMLLSEDSAYVAELQSEGWTTSAVEYPGDISSGWPGTYAPHLESFVVYAALRDDSSDDVYRALPLTLAFDERWVELETSGELPRAEAHGAMTHLPGTQEVLLFGGRWRPSSHSPSTDDSLLFADDLWVLRPTGQSSGFGGCAEGEGGCATGTGGSGTGLWWVLVGMVVGLRRVWRRG